MSITLPGPETPSSSPARPAPPFGRARVRWLSVAVLVAVTGLGAWAALPAMDGEVIADNDFVAHYAYARYLAEEFWLRTGASFGWTPLFNLGTPFLLFNPPPLVSVATALLSRLTDIPVVWALKLYLCAAFLAVPWLAFLFARRLGPDLPLFPPAAALLVALFSSELFGLEFFFKNGMVNAAVAVPLMQLVLIAGLAVVRTAPLSRLALLLLAAAVCLLVLDHVLSLYMVCLALVALAVLDAPDRWLPSLARVGVGIALGLGLAAFWLVPSLPVAIPKQAAFTWWRPAGAVVDQFLSGSLFSSYPAGFYPRFFSTSSVGAFLTILGLTGLVVALFQERRACLGLAGATLLIGWVVLGPRAALVLAWLPLYDRLLWFRFLTLFILLWCTLAGLGLAAVLRVDPAGGRSRVLFWATCLTWWAVQSLVSSHPTSTWEPPLAGLVPLALAGLVVSGTGSGSRTVDLALPLLFVAAMTVRAGSTLLDRSATLSTAASYAAEWRDLETVAGWLRVHARPGDRVYSEFPMWNLPDRLSVNLSRHLLPVLTGVGEVAGWIYENSPTATGLHRNGLFWFNPFPILARQDLYNVKYVVAASPNLRSALTRDVRWQRKVDTTSFGLYECTAFTDRLVRAPGATVGAVTRQHLPGGGYRIGFTLQKDRSAGEGPVVVTVATSFSAYWGALVDGRSVEPFESDDGLLALAVPAGQPAVFVTLQWDCTVQSRIGLTLTLVGAALAGALVLRRGMPLAGALRAVPGQAGLLVGGAVLVVLAWALLGADVAARLNEFGPQDGLAPVFEVDEIRVGTFDDGDNGGLAHLMPDSWGPPVLISGLPARIPLPIAGPHAALRVAPGRDVRLLIEGGAIGGGADSRVVVRLTDPAGRCVFGPVRATPGQPFIVPARALHTIAPDGIAPGVPVMLRIEPGMPREIHRIRVDSGLTYLSGESLRNSPDDSGLNGAYYTGLPGLFPQNGSQATMHLTGRSPSIEMAQTVRLPAGRCQLWARVLSVPDAWSRGRAVLTFFQGADPVGSTSSVRRSTDRPDPGFALRWFKIGLVSMDRDGETLLRVRATPPPSAPAEPTAEFWADLDLLAFVPVRPDPR